MGWGQGTRSKEGALWGAMPTVVNMGRRGRASQYLGAQKSDLKEGIKGYEVAGWGRAKIGHWEAASMSLLLED